MTRRTRKHNLATDEAMTLRYIDGDVTADEAEAIVNHFATGSTTAARRVEGMRDDRRILSELETPAAPAGLVEDVLSSVERSLLLDDDPVAPPVRYPSRSRWTVGRLAAAAVVLLLVSVGVLIVRQTMLTLDNRPDLVDNTGGPAGRDPTRSMDRPPTPNTTHGDSTLASTSGDSESETRVAHRSDHPNLPPILPLPGVDSLDPARNLADERSALAAGGETSANVGEASSDWGLRLTIETADLGETLLELVNQLDDRETELAQNAEIIEGRIETSPMEYYATALNRSPGRQSVPIPNAAINLIPRDIILDLRDHLRPSRRVPIQAQLDYQKEGYQWVLVGTFSEIRRLRDELHRRRDHQANWLRPEGIGRIDDLMPPRRPTAAEWGAILLWWHNPQERWALVEQARAAYEPEPVIRVPVRFEIRRELGPLRPQPDGDASNDR